ncbi:MAG: hypothetical protein JSS86_19655, partial [Cyanobacteria bacterium SZAS LIN-2]|nr:hypothetical protein [Cyanobacteria bacterium SZAS LIN-2]
DARGNVKILRNGQLTTGAAFKFKVSSDEYLITHPETSVEGTQLISRTDCPGKVITIFKTPRMALANSEQFSENGSCGYGKLLADNPPLFDKNQDLAKLYRTAATTNKWFLFGRPVEGQLTCLSVNPSGVGNDRYGIRAFINPRANVAPNRIHLNAGHTQAPILSGDVKTVGWLRISGSGSYNPSAFRPYLIKNRFGFDVLRGVPSPNLVVDIPKRAIGYRDGRPVAEGPHTKFSEDTPHTEQSWTY